VNRPLHPRRGTDHPLAAVPERVPRSVRRSTSLDALRPTGLRGPCRFEGRAGDLVTDAAAATDVVAHELLPLLDGFP